MVAEVAPGWHELLTQEGQQHLASLEASLKASLTGGETGLQAGARLRAAGVPGDLVAALLTQADLRRKAQGKFGPLASRMLFTPAGLEQASRSQVAALHARRFANAGCTVVADLGCGIGTESLALQAAGVGVVAVEIDPFTARIAEFNLEAAAAHRAAGGPQFRVEVGDATVCSLDGVDGVFLDPARRTAGHRDTRRLASAADYSPSLDFAFDLGSRVPTGIKLGPGFDRELIPTEAEAQWVSVAGSVVEMSLWFGAVAREGVHRSALVLGPGSTHELSAQELSAHELSAPADSPDAELRPLGAYLYEPDGAVIRARLIGLLAGQLDAGMISDQIAYLTSDTLTETPFAQAFRVIELLTASEKQLKRALAERGIGTLEIKKRGANVDPAALRRRLRLKGPNSATLVLTRVAGSHTAILVERV